ncbi:MAG: hypothetical protein ACI9CP_001357 [Cryomorphaceae bacterium]|jgi:hypothetical protein
MISQIQNRFAMRHKSAETSIISADEAAKHIYSNQRFFFTALQ